MNDYLRTIQERFDQTRTDAFTPEQRRDMINMLSELTNGGVLQVDMSLRDCESDERDYIIGIFQRELETALDKMAQLFPAIQSDTDLLVTYIVESDKKMRELQAEPTYGAFDKQLAAHGLPSAAEQVRRNTNELVHHFPRLAESVRLALAVRLGEMTGEVSDETSPRPRRFGGPEGRA